MYTNICSLNLTSRINFRKNHRKDVFKNDKIKLIEVEWFGVKICKSR